VITKADFNGDQQVDFFDYLDFVAAFDAGCEQRPTEGTGTPCGKGVPVGRPAYGVAPANHAGMSPPRAIGAALIDSEPESVGPST
jgi:hypothetical protein